MPETQEAWEKRAAVWAEKGVRLHLPLKSFVQRNDVKFRTPSTSDVEGGVMEIREGANARYKLRDQAHAMLLPTPRHADAACPRLTQTHEGKNFAILTDTARTMLPTPRLRDSYSRDSKKMIIERNEENRDLDLTAKVKYDAMMFPTPSTQDIITHPDAVLTQDGRRASKDGTTSHSLSLPDRVGVKDSRRLNPEWVSLLMGVPAWWLDLRADGNSALAAPELIEIQQGWIDGTWDAGHSPLREITDKKEWKERIMALGNGVVPQCAMVVANEMMTWRLDNGTT